ncbi:MAG TPA: sigma-70 family RNA polymerase sigma factor [Dehalococcoidales bacterium]|nr:sigma-70 family RNA polymerase sigma factor [Dehalococcoidales bacterium]
MQDEVALVQRAQKKDAQAFSEIYEAYFDKIYRYISVRIRNEMEAEDLTQQVFMKMLHSISGYKLQGVPFSSWIYRIAHNQVVDFMRQHNKKATVDIEGLPLPDTGDDPQHLMERQFDITELKKAMQHLTESQQEVLALRFTGEIPIAQCAEIMGKSEGAIKALQHSAVQSLRKALVRKLL